MTEETKINPLQDAKETLRKIEEANKKSEELLRQHQELEAERIISGKADAGIIQPQKSKDEIIKERVNASLIGTGYKI